MYRVASLAALLLVSTSIAARQAADREKQWEQEIAAFERSDAVSPPPQNGYLFVGSSSIRMWKDLDKEFAGKAVINRGFGGSEIRDSTYFIPRIVTPYRPKMILMYAGDNDINAGRKPEEVCQDFAEFAAKAREAVPGVRIAYISIKPSPARWSKVDEMRSANSQIRAYIRKQKRMAYIDIFPAMLGPDGKPRPELYKEDGLHPSAAAYALWQKIIAPYLK